MRIPKKYFQDRTVLLLLTVNTFIVVLSSLMTLLRLGNGASTDYIYAQYRSNLGLSAYIPGGVGVFFSLILFSLLVLAFHTVLSMRVYAIRHHFARAVLMMATLLLLATAIVSNALLGLR